MTDTQAEKLDQIIKLLTEIKQALGNLANEIQSLRIEKRIRPQAKT